MHDVVADGYEGTLVQEEGRDWGASDALAEANSEKTLAPQDQEGCLREEETRFRRASGENYWSLAGRWPSDLELR